MSDLAKLFHIAESTARKWAAEDRWRRRGTRPKLYAMADAQASYERRRSHGPRVTRHLNRRYGNDSSGACGT